MSTVPKQSRQWSSYLESLRSGARGGSHTPLCTCISKTRLSYCYCNGNVLYIHGPTLCSQIQTRTKPDKVRQTTVPRKSRNFGIKSSEIQTGFVDLSLTLSALSRASTSIFKHHEGALMATENAIFRITLTNWEKHNSHQKKGYKATLIPNRFCEDAKLRVLPMTHRWLFLNLVLTCSDLCRNTVELSSKTVRNMLETNLNIVRVLERMQELQLLTFEKVPLIEENRKKRKESNGIEFHALPKKPKKAIATSASPSVQTGQHLVGVYCEEWKLRYGINPPLRAQDTKQLKSVGETNGLERTSDLLRAYLGMNEAWMLQKRHDLATFFSNMTAVAQFMENGRTLTRADLRVVESGSNLQNTLRKIREEGI